MNRQDIRLEPLTDSNISEVRSIRREDISEDFADTADTIMELTRYGAEHSCLGHTYVIRYKTVCIGVILLGEAIPWDTDPEEMKQTPFYRLMGFIIDNRYRSLGIGGYVLEKAIDNCYSEFGVRPIALGCHKDNHRAASFYTKHGFRKTDVMEGNDYYYLRYPQGENMNQIELTELFKKYCKKLRITPAWDVELRLVEDASWTKTGDFKIDCDDRKAILFLNALNPKQENFEEVIVHELMHLKMYPLDQVTESLIASHFEEGTAACDFAYRQFFLSLEQTVEELTKCFLFEFGEDKELSYGRCDRQRSFNELYDGLKNIE